MVRVSGAVWLDVCVYKESFYYRTNSQDVTSICTHIELRKAFQMSNCCQVVDRWLHNLMCVIQLKYHYCYRYLSLFSSRRTDTPGCKRLLPEIRLGSGNVLGLGASDL